jgi:8-oxo-dGTP pyrophosphatase MutT (NUDIX family)
MSTLQRHEIACAIIIDTQGRFLLQQRDNVPGIQQPGKVGLFGGHREEGETYLQCLVREIHEEIGYFVSPDRFENLVSYDGIEVDSEGGIVRGEFFVARDVPADALTVTEGSLLIVEPDKLAAVEHKFAPSTRFAINALVQSAVVAIKR